MLLTGIHLLHTGRVEPNLLSLHERYGAAGIQALVDSKTEEKAQPEGLDWEFHAGQLDHFAAQLDEAFNNSTLPDTRDLDAVNDLLVRLRLAGS